MYLFAPIYRDTRITREADTCRLISMFGRSPKQAVQEAETSKEVQLVNITNKTPTVGPGRIVTSPDKVPRMMEGAEIVTGKRNKKRERHELAEEGSFRQQTTDFQQYVEIEQSNVDEPPKFDPVQESSVDPHKMPPSA